MTHTKGPWSLDSVYDVFAGEYLIAVTCGEEYGQWREAEDGGKAEFIANAKLIAAAPELLEALQLWLDYDNQDEADFANIGPMLLYANAIDATRAAIAKATS